MMLSDVCLSDVCRVQPVGGRRVWPAGCMALIGPGFRCRPGRGHIVASARLQLVTVRVRVSVSVRLRCHLANIRRIAPRLRACTFRVHGFASLVCTFRVHACVHVAFSI